MSLSVLLSLYGKSEVQDLHRCLESIWAQTFAPTEIIIVLDGPVSDDVDRYCQRIRDEHPVRLVRFPENRGLGPALRDGLEQCAGTYVARMDTDDISVEERFELQVAFLDAHPAISVVGGNMKETLGTGGQAISRERRVPLTPDEIGRAARYRNPMNHPTIMFRRTDVMGVGSYQDFPLLEDYHLMARMIGAGKKLANLDRVLVETELDDEFFRRRGGIAYLRQELRLSAFFLKSGFHNLAHAIVFVGARAPYRVMPFRLRRSMYLHTLRSKGWEGSAHGIDVHRVL